MQQNITRESTEEKVEKLFDPKTATEAVWKMRMLELEEYFSALTLEEKGSKKDEYVTKVLGSSVESSEQQKQPSLNSI